ncbi:MAG: PH domain-containing protein [Rhodomicrobium sp.]
MEIGPMAMDNSAEAIFIKELGHGERLLWSGTPRQGIFFRPGDIFMVPFSLFWGGFAFFWEYNVIISDKSQFFFTLFGIPFVLMGIYIIAGRFFLDSYQRSRTYYGVTDRRALILNGIVTRQLKSISLQNLNEISLTERSDGSGDISFGSMPPIYAMWRGTAWPGMSDRLVPAFEFIDGVRTVYDLIKKAQHPKT